MHECEECGRLCDGEYPLCPDCKERDDRWHWADIQYEEQRMRELSTAEDREGWI